MNNATINCDNCDWSTKVAWHLVPTYHNKTCPKCNDCILITDADLSAWQGLDDLVKTEVLSLNLEEKGVRVEINTEGLRDG